MGSIFIRYGLKSGGGAPFLRRTRNAFGQLQTRTRTGSTFNQQQRRICTGQTSSFNSTYYQPVSNNATGCIRPGGCWSIYSSPYNCKAQFEQCSNIGAYSCAGCNSYITCGCNFPDFCAGGAVCTNVSGTQCGFSCGGWYASTAGATYPACSNGATRREARTQNVCAFSAFTAFSNVASCVVATPSCSNGALQRECNTEFSFREQDWSPFEEVDVCITSNPTPASGAVQVECVVN